MNVWNTSNFTQAILLQARYYDSFHTTRLPSHIILNQAWTVHFRQLYRVTHQTGNEAAKAIKTNLAQSQLLIQHDYLVGDKNMVLIECPLQITPYGEEIFVGTIHTHPDSTGFSPADIFPLLWTHDVNHEFIILRNKVVLLVVRTNTTIAYQSTLEDFELACNKRFFKNWRLTYKNTLQDNIKIARQLGLVMYAGILHAGPTIQFRKI